MPIRSTRAAVVAVAALAVVALAGCFGAPAYEGPKRPHFDGEQFSNVPPSEEHGFTELLEWKLLGQPGVPWPERAPERAPVVAKARVDRGIRATLVGHATVLVQLDGLALLTDPVWSDRVGPVSFAGPLRYDAPAIRLEDLPKIDGVLLSHSHYDHCDAPTLRKLADRFAMPIYGGLGTKAMLDDLGVPGGVDLDWWQVAPLAGLRLHFVPVRHWSRRGIEDHNVVLWGGFVVEGRAGRVYFAGDTAYGPHFAEARSRIGAADVALLPIGAYLPRWFMAPMHMDPGEAVRAHLDLGAQRSLGMHWGTFDLADEGRYQAAGELGLALDAAKIARTAFVAARPGDAVVWARAGEPAAAAR